MDAAVAAVPLPTVSVSADTGTVVRRGNRTRKKRMDKRIDPLSIRFLERIDIRTEVAYELMIV
jgi:hypothetical protein